ncbi:hypothetical protein CPT_Maja_052 [Burkholderia phage Maja]|uniref:Uncharacterized protein n=1 Tax=Burkholderia phage Maja TaxID=2767571 RepID=A0A7S6TXC4_9CAUD|nr:hypothetical protein CPT_Maja_052 [Burkholderia phage Maja]
MKALEFYDKVRQVIEPSAVTFSKREGGFVSIEFNTSATRVRLAEIMKILPDDCRIMTDLGSSIFSGYGELSAAEYHAALANDPKSRPVFELTFHG